MKKSVYKELWITTDYVIIEKLKLWKYRNILNLPNYSEDINNMEFKMSIGNWVRRFHDELKAKFFYII